MGCDGQFWSSKVNDSFTTRNTGVRPETQAPGRQSPARDPPEGDIFETFQTSGNTINTSNIF